MVKLKYIGSLTKGFNKDLGISVEHGQEYDVDNDYVVKRFWVMDKG